MHYRILKSLCATATLAVACLFAGCETIGDGVDIEAERAAQLERVKAEPPGNYYVGRRYYKVDYKFWGYIRKPGQPWSTAKMVMLNEQKHLAPDRETGTLGTDNGAEYKLFGSFSGDTVYEPASNGFYPEFVLTGYELISSTPHGIYTARSAALDPARRVIAAPF